MLVMKKSSLSFMVGCLFTLSAARAQSDYSGVYLTPGDFLAGKICAVSKISDEDLLSCRRVVVDAGGAERKLDKKDIYAVRCRDGAVVRIYKAGNYPVLNPGERILIYRVVQYPAGKGDWTKIRYYFSKDAGSDITELTMENVRAAFQDNHKFDEAVDAEFRSDKDLYAYDNLHKCYKLDRVYAATQD